jgi:hypothetical protein
MANNGLQLLIDVADADPNESCIARMFNNLMRLFRKNARVRLSGAANGVQLVYVGSGNPPDELKGLVKIATDEQTGQRVDDIEFYYGGGYRGMLRLLDLGACVYIEENTVDVPWEKVSGAPTISDGTDTLALCRYVGYPVPFN